MIERQKHAYLIVAHKDQWQLEILLKLLDIEENDIYLHIDAGSKEIDLSELRKCVVKGNLFFIERISVEWGRYSIVESTLILLKKAVGNRSYSYYHLLSGQDLPIRPIRVINDSFNNGNQNAIYIDFCNTECTHKVVFERYRYYSKLIGNHYLSRNRLLWHLSWPVRKIRNIWVKHIRDRYGYGSAWFDVDQDMAEKILENEKWIRSSFKTFFASDEIFLHSLIKKLNYTDRCTKSMRVCCII